MKKKRWSTLFILLFTLSNLFTLNVQAEEEIYLETANQEYLADDQAVTELKQLIHQALDNLDDEINVAHLNISIDKLQYINDLFNEASINTSAEHYLAGCHYNTFRNTITTIHFRYYLPKSQIKELNSKSKQILDSIIKPSMTEFEKELAIHDYIVFNTSYEKIPPDSYTAYGALIKGKAVCRGYAEAMKLLLNMVGIEAIIISSPKMNHAWNMVTIDGEKYHVDATWDGAPTGINGQIGYHYLNISDEQIKETHFWDYDKYPKATSEKYSFFRGQSTDTAKRVGNTLYYKTEDCPDKYLYLYQVDFKTLVHERIPNIETTSFDVAGDWIYFRNDTTEGQGRLYKAKTDGTHFTRLNNTYANVSHIKDGYLYYIEWPSQVEKRLKIDVPTEPVEPAEPEVPEEDAPTIDDGFLDRFKKWVKSFFIKPLDSWEIKFNLPLSKASIHTDNVYVVDQDGKILKDLEINASDSRTIIVTPGKEYAAGQYYLIIENFESDDGKILSEDIKVEFTVE